MERLPYGTKEYLIVDVTDRLANLSTLSGTAPTFDVDHEDGTSKINDRPAVLDGNIPMSVKCLVDTVVDSLPPDPYDLFVTINAAPEAPRLGPFRFVVE